MRKLDVNIEVCGNFIHVGEIKGNSYLDACFSYDDAFMNAKSYRPISVSLPFQKNVFTPKETKCFFEGLLPEGFSRRAVAMWVKTDENDYLTILEKLGSECLGAIQIKGEDADEEECYEKLSLDRVRALASEGATNATEILIETHLSLAGASGKVGLYYDENNKEWYLPKGNAASTHIVKQSHVRLKGIVYNENICMKTASLMGIEVPENFIIDVGKGEDRDVLFATKRYDRKVNPDKFIDGLQCPYRLHQEDFSQAMGIPASNKYEKKQSHYLARMFELIRNFCSNPIEDQLKLWDMIVFNVLIGNTDCHVKNFSLLYSEDFKNIKLAPAYDIVNTMQYGTTYEMPFYIGGELDIRKINRETFRIAAKEVGLGEKIAMRHYDEIREKFRAATLNFDDNFSICWGNK